MTPRIPEAAAPSPLVMDGYAYTLDDNNLIVITDSSLLTAA